VTEKAVLKEPIGECLGLEKAAQKTVEELEEGRRSSFAISSCLSSASFSQSK
jgi:hypothetical protein